MKKKLNLFGFLTDEDVVITAFFYFLLPAKIKSEIRSIIKNNFRLIVEGLKQEVEKK